jgi:hypothetical protein
MNMRDVKQSRKQSLFAKKKLEANANNINELLFLLEQAYS